jgi:DNA polymerase III delta prime subunit
MDFNCNRRTLKEMTDQCHEALKVVNELEQHVRERASDPYLKSNEKEQMARSWLKAYNIHQACKREVSILGTAVHDTKKAFCDFMKETIVWKGEVYMLNISSKAVELERLKFAADEAERFYQRLNTQPATDARHRFLLLDASESARMARDAVEEADKEFKELVEIEETASG